MAEMSSWADEIESESNNLPPPREEIKGNTKIVTEYLMKDDKKVKSVRTYKIEKKMVPKAIAQRKSWKKFGASANDKPGPHSSTTVVSEEIMMQFITNKDDADKEEQTDAEKKPPGKGNVKCRICKMDHWTKECPYKDDLGAIKESLEALEKESGARGPEETASPSVALPQTTGKYVPPSRRGPDGAARPGMGDSRLGDRKRDDTAAVRVSNLPESTTDKDIKEMFEQIGRVARIFLAKDKTDQQKCKGFAFVNYVRTEDAETAIRLLNGHRYQFLILHVEWAKPSADR